MAFVPAAPPTAPSQVTGVAASPRDSSALVSWAAPANGGSPITSYRITPYVGGVAQAPTTITGNPPATSTTVTALTNGTSYTFTVSATNLVGTGAASTPSAPVTPAPPTVPAQVAGVSAQPGNTTANVSWTAPADGGATISSFTVTPFVGGVAQTPTTVTGSPPAPSATITGLTNGSSYTFTVTASNAVGAGSASTPSAPIVPFAPSVPVLDAQTSVNSTGTTATTSAFSTAQAGETLFAFVSADGPASPGTQSVTVSGAGLTWTLVSRANSQYGTSEIWSAPAPAKLAGVSVTSTEVRTGFHQQLTVVAMQFSSGVGTIQTLSAASGAPSLTMTASRAGSLVFGVGNDWDNAVGRTVGSGQALTSQWVDSSAGDTFWVQNTTAPTTVAGAPVTVNDVAPVADRWNLAAIEIKGPANPTAPAAPSGVTATAGNATATVSWTAPANGGSPITGYTITPYIGTTAQTPTTVTGNPPATSTTITGLTNGTAYTFTVTATNAVGTCRALRAIGGRHPDRARPRRRLPAG